MGAYANSTDPYRGVRLGSLLLAYRISIKIKMKNTSTQPLK